ncbi:MAG: hypothetical protein KME07_17895 [Pegethrix bostrychoides GSE-TBD4-15B]|jgi:Ca2+-binding RTX toxin-like protein|uniref:Calcium-binding protein n=1 Tax=Pegethrix bostrychoides GSE-TBD4-15B TaxID=2839662 RepID=A0A951PCQ6_9CYAN|nr:hypothetical protein [Pegethrix bostrychoides GSE-TBD4-15B]
MSANSSRRDLRVNTFVSGRQQNPDIAVGSLDSFVITWQSERQDGDGFGIFGRTYSLSGAPVASEFQVNSTTQGDQTAAAVAADGNGNFVVTWASDQANGRGLYAQLFQSDGQRIGSEFRVNSSSSNSFQQQSNPDVARDALGNFVVVYESRGINNDSFGQDTSGTGIFGRRFNSTGASIGSEFRVNTITDRNQTEPAIAMNGLGEFVVTWVGPSLGGNSIFGQRYSNTGQPIGIEFQANSQTGGSQTSPAVAIADSGEFVVVWQGTDGDDDDGSGIYAQRYDANGNPRGGEILVNDTTRGDQVTPSVAIDSGGDFTVVWSGEQNNRDTVIYGQRFFANGNRDGSEFEVNDSGSDDQINPAVVLSPTSDFVVAWENQDGSNSDILARTNVFKRRIRGTNGDDNLTGGDQGDQILGRGGMDRLQGLGGNDVLNGGNGADRLEGGDGNDVLQGGNNADTLEGGDGNDTLTGGGGADTFVLKSKQGSTLINDFEVGVDLLGLSSGIKRKDIRIEQQGENTIISAKGRRLATLLGVQAADISVDSDFTNASSTGRPIRGTNKADELTGGGGGDEILGLGGRDTLSGRGGDDLIEGGAGGDEIFGEDGNDELIGGNGKDTLVGGKGDDFLQAGDGNDSLTGGAGSDTFFLQRKTGRTTIQDFQDGVDSFSLDTDIRSSSLVFQAQGSDTLISSAGDILALVKNTRPSQFSTSASDFV